jgi:hypothetical protein
MPRRARPGMQLVIEGLSDGKRGLRDDFTGEPISEPSGKPRASASVVLDQRNRDKRAAQRAMLAKVAPGMLGIEPQVIHVPVGKRLVGIITDKSGNQFTVTMPKRPFRRV